MLLGKCRLSDSLLGKLPSNLAGHMHMMASLQSLQPSQIDAVV